MGGEEEARPSPGIIVQIQLRTPLAYLPTLYPASEAGKSYEYGLELERPRRSCCHHHFSKLSQHCFNGTYSPTSPFSLVFTSAVPLQICDENRFHPRTARRFSVLAKPMVPLWGGGLNSSHTPHCRRLSPFLFPFSSSF